jgi:excisionase family DNA binding protein
MVPLNPKPPPAGRSAPCPHRAAATAISVLRGTNGQQLSRLTCGPCQRSWWESDGNVIELADALALIRDASRSPQAPLRQPQPAPSSGRRWHPTARPVLSGQQPPGGPTAGALAPSPPADDLTSQAGPAPPHRAPGAFPELLSWAADALRTDLVLFAVPGDLGWRAVLPARDPASSSQTTRTDPASSANGTNASTRARQRASTAAAEHSRWSSLVATTLHQEALLSTVAQLRGPVEITGKPLSTICPCLAAAGVLAVLAATVYSPSGAPEAVFIAAYRRSRPGTRPSPADKASRPGTEAVGCTARLLATAYRHIQKYELLQQRPTASGHQPYASGSAPRSPARRRTTTDDVLHGDPDGLLLAREVSTLFAVSKRTVANWVNAGTLPATRTAGGHLRFRRCDVVALYEGTRPTSAAVGHPALG